MINDNGRRIPELIGTIEKVDRFVEQFEVVRHDEANSFGTTVYIEITNNGGDQNGSK